MFYRTVCNLFIISSFFIPIQLPLNSNFNNTSDNFCLFGLFQVHPKSISFFFPLHLFIFSFFFSFFFINIIYPKNGEIPFLSPHVARSNSKSSASPIAENILRFPIVQARKGDELRRSWGRKSGGSFPKEGWQSNCKI